MSKRNAILTAALELLVEKGVHNTPMSEIAKAAGTGMGTIYNHFPNKNLLINEIYLGIKEKEEAVYLAVNTTQPIKTQFEQYLRIIMEFFVEHPSYFKFLQQLEASPIITKENRNQGSKSVEMVAVLLRKGQENRIIKNIGIDELLTFIGGAISSYVKWHLHKTDTTKSSPNNQIQMVWDAIKA